MKDLPTFIEQLQERLKKGSATYGDQSFSRPFSEIKREISEECLDLAGWGFILWSKVQAMGQSNEGPIKNKELHKENS